MSDLSLFRAIPEPRGCGEREPGGVYAESGVGPFGQPLEHFMIDPPQPLPEGLNLVNKPQLWPRTQATGEPEVDEAGLPIFDLLIHVGASHYPWAPDYIEETRRLGASRRLNPNLDLSLLTRASRMLLAHPKAMPQNWRDLTPPQRCHKRLSRHDAASYTLLSENPLHDPKRPGPCLFKLWELIPQEQAAFTQAGQEGQHPFCLRRIGTTMYQYQPTGEQVTAWSEAFVLALPLTGFSLIQYADGSVNERAKTKLLTGQEIQGDRCLPFYETPI
jgi:hypothetical protein